METKNHLDKIERMFAFIAKDKDGNEGIPAFEQNGVMWPLVGADWTRIESFRKAAETIANHSGQTITLVEFSVRKDLEIIHKLN